MKRKIAIILAIFMLVGSLSACGKKVDNNDSNGETKSSTNQKAEDTKKDVELKLAWLGDGTDKEKLDKILQAYTDETGIKINTVYIPGTWSEYFTKIQTMIAGGTTIDLAYIAIEGFEMFVDMGIAESINPFYEKNKDAVDELFNDVPNGIGAPFTMNDQLYGFPLSFNNVVMHFNTKRLGEAGVAVPKEGWNKEEFLAMCEKLTKEVDGVKQYAVAIPDGYFMMEAWIRNNGGSFMTSDYSKSTINAPESVEMFQLWQDLVYKYGYAPIPEPNVNAIQSLVDGQVAMGSWGRWPLFTYTSNEFKEVTLQYLPSFKTNQVQFGVDGIFVSNATKNYDEACDLALWMASEDFAKEFLTIGNIPARASLAKELVPVPGFPENNEIFYSDVDEAVAISSPKSYAGVAAIVNEAFSKIVRNKEDVKTVLDDAAEKMNEILKK